MRKFLLLLLTLSGVAAHAQADYPVPPGSNTRLFYIQHSSNYNTYVYDANMQDSTILFTGKDFTTGEPVTEKVIP